MSNLEDDQYEFNGDLMDVDLSHSSVNVSKKDQLEADPDSIPNPLDLIPEAPLKQFRVNYFINEAEPIEMESHVQVRTNDTLKSEQAVRELLKTDCRNYQNRAYMIRINYVQEEDIDHQKHVT